jgi:hypothetical protein
MEVSDEVVLEKISGLFRMQQVGESKDKSGISRVQSNTSKSNVRSYCLYACDAKTDTIHEWWQAIESMRLWATGATIIGGHGQVENLEI